MKLSWSRSSAWAASMRCHASSHARIPSGCGSSWSLPPMLPMQSAHTSHAETLVVLSLAVAAALAIKVPALFGLRLDGGDELRSTPGTPACSSSRCSPSTSCGSAGRTLQAASGWRCPSRPGLCSPTSTLSAARSDTEVLTALHLPIALWLAVGFAYVRSRWFADGGRMDFVRFSGELAIYYVLIALGGGVLTALHDDDVQRHRDEG